MTKGNDQAERRADAVAFEREVRRIAGVLYPDESGGARMIEDRERDGVFITEDAVVVIEATTSLEKAKAESDGRKLKALADQMAKRYVYKAVKAFFVTQSDPTAHQVEAIHKIGLPVVAISFAKMKARLIDSHAYMEARADHAFGSARDPETDALLVRDPYVALDFVDMDQANRQYNLSSLVAQLNSNARIVLVGEFGAGKSMTLREIYLHFRKRHLAKDDAKFCLHLNLNDHESQTDPAEALTRHATKIGYHQPHQLVRAWRSGEAHLLLDGFDEVFSSGWASESKPLVEIRRKSVELVRRFMQETPQSVGIIVAGRQHFFDNVAEMNSALGLPPNSVRASATDFTESQVQEYLRNRDWEAELPDWLPRRPLIVGYLAGRHLFDVVEELAKSDAGQGWDCLLAAICAREARADRGLDEVAIRAIVERLATLARKTTTGLGPLEFQDLVTVFRDLRGKLPDEGAYGVLQRLPGLRVHDGQTNSRIFVDDEFVDAARAGDVYNWLINPSMPLTSDSLKHWQTLLGPTGLEVLRYRCDETGITTAVVQAALKRLERLPGTDALQADLVRFLFSLGASALNPLFLQNLHVPSLSLPDGCDASSVTFSQCLIEVLDVTEVEAVQRLPIMDKCVIGMVEGVAGFDDLARGRFIDCEINSFSDSTENMSAILKLDLSDKKRVALTILRKIFVQSGHSRKESALYRGSLTQKQKVLIPEVLASLQAQGAIRMMRRRDTTFWEPNRAMYSRVKSVLDAPTTNFDHLVD